MSASPVAIIADTRERAVHPFLEHALGGEPSRRSFHHSVAVPHIVQQIKVGDFLIISGDFRGGVNEGQVLAVVERKTHADFASSIGDGRHENRKKMMELRNLTGCRVFYLLEGPAFPAPSRRFGRIPWSTIHAAALSLSVRDGIYLLRSKDAADTAAVLNGLARSFIKHGCPDAEPEPTRAPDAISTDEALIAASGGGVRSLPPDVLAVRAWSSVAGVSIGMGAALVAQVSVRDLATGAYPYERIGELRNPQNRQISGLKNILRSVRNLVRLEKSAASFVGSVPGFSRKNALELVRHFGGLQSLCAATEEQLAAAPYGAKSVGAVRATRLTEVLNAVTRTDESVPPAGQPVAATGQPVPPAGQPAAAAGPPVPPAAPANQSVAAVIIAPPSTPLGPMTLIPTRPTPRAPPPVPLLPLTPPIGGAQALGRCILGLC